MQTIRINSRLIAEEREIILNLNGIDRMWRMDTTITKYANKAKKQGWKQLVEYVYEDGTPCGGVFEAPERAITIRSTEKRQMSDKQLENLFDDDED